MLRTLVDPDDLVAKRGIGGRHFQEGSKRCIDPKKSMLESCQTSIACVRAGCGVVVANARAHVLT